MKKEKYKPKDLVYIGDCPEIICLNPFSLKLGNKTYEGNLLFIDSTFYIILNLLEMFGKKQYDFMKRNKITIDDNKGLWDFIKKYFKK